MSSTLTAIPLTVLPEVPGTTIRITIPRLTFSAAMNWVALLNLMDAFLTLEWIRLGHAQEANPMMLAALGTGPAFFVFVKIFLVCAGVWALRRFARSGLARVGIVIAVAVYTGITMFHATHLVGYALTHGWP